MYEMSHRENDGKQVYYAGYGHWMELRGGPSLCAGAGRGLAHVPDASSGGSGELLGI